MSLPTQQGRYIARPLDWTIEESGDNKLPTFVCSFELLQFLGQQGWAPVADLQITGYFYLWLKSGDVNERQIKSLREALGWDGRSMATLANGDWKAVEVQLSVVAEEYNGRSKIKVAYINPRDYEPGHIEKKPEVVQAMAAKYDMQLRAMAGTAPAPSRPASKPPASAPAAETKTQAARKAAWAAFQAKHPELDSSALADDWRAHLKFVFPNQISTTFGEAEWNKIIQSLEKPEPAMAGAPFGDEAQFAADDIPF